MPVVLSNEGWVKVPAPPPRKSAKPVNPVNAFRGPLAYITGRPEFKEPVKKQSIKQLLIEAAPPPPPAQKPSRSSKPRDRVTSAPVPTKSRHRAPTEIFEEVDEEIISPQVRPDDSASRRSASPAASRHTRAAPSVRSRREPARSVYDDDQDGHRHSRSKRHVSSQPVYYDDEPRHHRSERSYQRERSRDRYRPDPYMHNYSTPHLPQIQPIVIYSTPPQQHMGCGGHHGCHSQAQYQQQYYAPSPMVQPAPAPAALPAPSPAPRPAPSVVSSGSSGSKASKAMSYKWYTATQPLAL
ncbi:hypothetical protein OHC33_008101 [Knufia fluminis]|uniref:Uncharacterized protein n=1 Tax=Knufia fluminis TaxID=191047 RepID=A0AAN8I3U8_9EURO|nr:hypothetical protein OHC33_008101 [Knufia fluminis]